MACWRRHSCQWVSLGHVKYHLNLERQDEDSEDESAAFPQNLHQPHSLSEPRAALCLLTILSPQKYSSEGFFLNKGKVKQLNCQTDNIQFSALSSMYSQKSLSHSGSLSRSNPLSTTQLS